MSRLYMDAGDGAISIACESAARKSDAHAFIVL
jgi:hypothetical protein